MGKTCLWMKYELILKDETFYHMENLHLDYAEMTVQIGREKKKVARYRLGIAHNEDWVLEEGSNGNGNVEPNEHYATTILCHGGVVELPCHQGKKLLNIRRWTSHRKGSDQAYSCEKT